MDRLSNNAHHDIRALMQENELSRIMDELIDRAAGTTAQGLRALGATAQITLERFRRLIALGQGVVQPSSPPFTAFLEALRLFLEAFNNSPSGYRLLSIARPAIVFYGLYGMSGPDDATRRLQNIVTHRGVLAEALDCYLGCGCCADQARCQILLDKALFDVDRAIDLYALGMIDFGEPEQRAAAYGYILDELINAGADHTKNYDCLGVSCGEDEKIEGAMTRKSLRQALIAIHDELWAPHINTSFTPRQRETMRDELCIQVETEKQWYSLLQTMAPTCINVNGLTQDGDQFFLNPTYELLNAAIIKISGVGPVIQPCVTEKEFPEDIDVSMSAIKTNTAYLPDQQGIIAIEPNMVDFGKVPYDELGDRTIVRSLVIGNAGGSTLHNIRMEINNDSPFTITDVSLNGVDLEEFISDGGQFVELGSHIAIGANEKLFVNLRFEPTTSATFSADSSAVINTEAYVGVLAVFACSYSASHPDAHCSDGQRGALSPVTGAAKLQGVLLGNDRPGEVLFQLSGENGQIITGKVFPYVLNRITGEVVDVPVRCDAGTVRVLIDRTKLGDISPDDLILSIKDVHDKVIVRSAVNYTPGKTITRPITLPKTVYLKPEPVLAQKLQSFAFQSGKVAKKAKTGGETWHVQGHLKNAKSKDRSGIIGYQVKLFDKDQRYADQLGEPAITIDKGYFEFRFDRAQFDDEFNQDGPDLYYQVLNKDGDVVYDSLKDQCPDPAYENVSLVKNAGRETDLGEILINRD